MLEQLTVAEALEKLAAREISAQELTAAACKRIDEVEGTIKAFVTLTKEQALAAAARVDAKLQAGEEIGSLAGVPMALKDNICTKGIRTTCSSTMLQDFVPPYSAAVYEHLKNAGSILVGKTNLDEFAMGSSTENSAFFTTRNPWDTERVPGGSIGGSAAAVAAGEVLFALGSDTGGSIRQPASFCGVVGMKPTYGRISRYGVVAFASSLDQVGPLTKDVRDCALVMNAIARHDPRDATSANTETPDYTKFLDGHVKGLKIGVPKEYFMEGMDPGVAAAVRKGIELLVSLGAEAEEISLPHTEYSIPVYYVIAPAEAASNFARFDGVVYGYRADTDSLEEMYLQTRGQGFAPEVKRRLLLCTYVLSAGCYEEYYLKALKVRTLIKEDFVKAFTKYDLLVTHTTPYTAFPVGAVKDPVKMYHNDICTIAASMAGLPAISIPCGLVGGLPVGMQLIGNHFDEGTIIRAAYAYEHNSEWSSQKPELYRKLREGGRKHE